MSQNTKRQNQIIVQYSRTPHLQDINLLLYRLIIICYVSLRDV